MLVNLLDASNLDVILNKITLHIKESQEQIYDIAEHTQAEYNSITDELDEIKNSITKLIERVEKMREREKRARIHLMDVSRYFDRYNEEDIKQAYDRAQKIQVELAMLQGQEQLLRDKRNNLERSLRRLQAMLHKAENMISHLGVVFDYLNKNMSTISSSIEGLKQVQQLGISIIKAQEEERKRVAREIHDGPAQLMANIVMRAEYILKLLEVNPAYVKDELVNLQELVRQSLQDVRKVIFDLRPMVLDDLGLIPAINRYVEDYRKQYGINAEFIFFGKQLRLPPATEIAMFRVVQEALSNVHKHARAKQVLIKIEQLAGQITILIKDNGSGFNIKTVEENKDRECYGLINMRERVQILKGEFKITSVPGKGTLINLSIPV